MKLEIDIVDTNLEDGINQFAGTNSITAEKAAVSLVKDGLYYRERMEDMQRLESAQQNGGISHDQMKDHFDQLRRKARARL